MFCMIPHLAHTHTHSLWINVHFLLLCFRDSAAADENKACTCFHALLVYLEEQWNRSVQENNILKGPDFSGMRDYLLVGQTCCYVNIALSILTFNSHSSSFLFQEQNN